METGKERRRFERFLFGADQRVTGDFKSLSTSLKTLNAEILNLSEGGMGLKFGPDAVDVANMGDQFSIQIIHGLGAFEFMAGMEISLRWVLGYKPERGLRVGCEFVHPKSDIQEEIRRFINHQIQQKLSE